MKKSVIYIVLAGLLWGTSGIFVHYLAPYGYTSLQMTGVRAAVAFLSVAIYALIFDRRLFRAKPWELLIFPGVGAAQFLTATSYYVAMQRVSVGVAVVLMYTAPIYVAVWSVLFLGEKMTRGKAISIGLMLLGCLFVSGALNGAIFDLVGLLVGVGSGIFYAAYTILTKTAVNRGTPPVRISLYGFLTMTLIGLFASDPMGTVNIAQGEMTSIPLLIGLGVFTFVLPYVLYTLSMRELPAGVASALGIVEPMAATLFGVLFLGDRLSVTGVIGITMIISAVFLVGRSER